MIMKAERRGGGIAAAYSQSDTRRRWVVSVTLRPLCPRERPVTHCTGSWVGVGANPRIVQLAASHYTHVATLVAYGSNSDYIIFPFFVWAVELHFDSMRSIYAFVQSLALACLHLHAYQSAMQHLQVCTNHLSTVHSTLCTTSKMDFEQSSAHNGAT